MQDSWLFRSKSIRLKMFWFHKFFENIFSLPENFLHLRKGSKKMKNSIFRWLGRVSQHQTDFVKLQAKSLD